MSDAKRQFVQFQAYRLDGVFHNLESNERLVAKQAFLGAWESWQARLGLITYAVSGLRPDCDLLAWRIADSLELLQDMTCRIQISGMGKFLQPNYSFLALTDGASYALKEPEARPGQVVPGKRRYLFLSAWSRTPVWHDLSAEQRRALAEEQRRAAAAHSGVSVHPPLTHGFDESEDLLVCEADSPEAYLPLAADLRALRGEAYAPAGPTFACVLKDIRDIVDCLG